MAKFIKVGTNGLYTQENTVEIGGAENAGKVVHLTSSGVLDETVMPSGIGVDTLVYIASENLSANEIVNIYNNDGTITVRKADAGVNNYAASGYVKEAVTSGENATVYINGICPGTFAVSDVDKPVFLSDTAGGTTLTMVSGTGKIHQIIGTVVSTTGFNFVRQSPILLA